MPVTFGFRFGIARLSSVLHLAVIGSLPSLASLGTACDASDEAHADDAERELQEWEHDGEDAPEHPERLDHSGYDTDSGGVRSVEPNTPHAELADIGGAGLEEHTPQPAQPGHPPQGPCGPNQNAHIKLDDDQRELYFCSFGVGEDSTEAILDVSHKGAPPIISTFECGIDVYDALSPRTTKPVFAEGAAQLHDHMRMALQRACSRPEGSVDDPHAKAKPQLQLVAEPRPQLVGTYCTGSGQSNFAYGPCDDLWKVYFFPGTFDPATTSYYNCTSDPYNPPSSWQCNGFNQAAAPWQSTGYCRPTSVTAHTRTGTTQLGRTDLTPGSSNAEAREFVASCIGNTQFQSFYRPSAGGAWIQTLDFTVPANTTAAWVYSSSTAKDIQYVAASATGAYHRYAGGFVTNAP